VADLFSVTAPMAIRYRDSGVQQVMVERLPYADGLLYLPAFWTDRPLQQALRYVPGPVEGDGPWKVGNSIVTVLACHGTDAALAGEFTAWQARVMAMGDAYPASSDIERLMKTHAVGVAGSDSCHPGFQRRAETGKRE
jgi:hypothetical protein